MRRCGDARPRGGCRRHRQAGRVGNAADLAGRMEETVCQGGTGSSTQIERRVLEDRVPELGGMNGRRLDQDSRGKLRLEADRRRRRRRASSPATEPTAAISPEDPSCVMVIILIEGPKGPVPHTSSFHQSYGGTIMAMLLWHSSTQRSPLD